MSHPSTDDLSPIRGLLIALAITLPMWAVGVVLLVVLR